VDESWSQKFNPIRKLPHPAGSHWFNKKTLYEVLAFGVGQPDELIPGSI